MVLHGECTHADSMVIMKRRPAVMLAICMMSGIVFIYRLYDVPRAGGATVPDFVMRLATGAHVLVLLIAGCILSCFLCFFELRRGESLSGSGLSGSGMAGIRRSGARMAMRRLSDNGGRSGRQLSENRRRNGGRLSGRAAIFMMIFMLLFGGMRTAWTIEHKCDPHAFLFDGGGVGKQTADKMAAVLVVERAQSADKLLCQVKQTGPPEATDISHCGEMIKNCRAIVNIDNGYLESAQDKISAKELIGKEVLIVGRIHLPQGARNPNTFDYAKFLYTKNIDLIIEEPRIVSVGRKNHLRYLPFRACFAVRECSYEYIAAYAGEKNAQLMLGLLLGDKSRLGDDVQEIFRLNGTAHILAVSGIHVGILYACLTQLMRGRRRRTGNFVIITCLLFYLMLAEFAVSAMRAISMIFLHILAQGLHRRYDFLNAAGISAIFVLMINPLSMFNADFQFSYTAIAAIGIVVRFLEFFLWRAAAATFVVQPLLFPLSAFHFCHISWVGCFLNVPIIFLAGILVPMGLLMSIFSAAEMILPNGFLPDGFENFFGNVTGQLCEMMVGLNESVYRTGGFEYVASPPLPAVLMFYGLLFFICSESAFILWHTKRSGIARGAAFIAAASLLCGHLFWVSLSGVDVVFVDVGQGDCIHIRTPHGRNILMDTGGSRYFDVGRRVVAPYLLRNGIDCVDLCLISHPDLDHCDGLDGISDMLKVREMAMFEGSRGALPYEPVHGLRAGDSLEIDGLTFEVLSPPSAGESASPTARLRGAAEPARAAAPAGTNNNDNSLVIRVSCADYTLLLTGDIGEPQERALTATPQTLKTDVLKVAHHGSRFSSTAEFLAAAAPQYAVIQVGKNFYGHPSPDTLERLEKQGIKYYRNDINGAVWFRAANHKLNFYSMYRCDMH